MVVERYRDSAGSGWTRRLILVVPPGRRGTHVGGRDRRSVGWKAVHRPVGISVEGKGCAGCLDPTQLLRQDPPPEMTTTIPPTILQPAAVSGRSDTGMSRVWPRCPYGEMTSPKTHGIGKLRESVPRVPPGVAGSSREGREPPVQFTGQTSPASRHSPRRATRPSPPRESFSSAATLRRPSGLPIRSRRRQAPAEVFSGRTRGRGSTAGPDGTIYLVMDRSSQAGSSGSCPLPRVHIGSAYVATEDVLFLIPDAAAAPEVVLVEGPDGMWVDTLSWGIVGRRRMCRPWPGSIP